MFATTTTAVPVEPTPTVVQIKRAVLKTREVLYDAILDAPFDSQIFIQVYTDMLRAIVVHG